jgi:hypothetical protein
VASKKEVIVQIIAIMIYYLQNKIAKAKFPNQFSAL